MNDFTALSIDEMEAVYSGGFKRARASLGVGAFGMSVSDLPPGFEHVPAHSHRFDGQVELYIALRGNGALEIAGKRVPIDDETIVLVGPSTVRRPIAGPDGLRLLSVGSTPGKAYVSFPQHESGVAESPVAELPGVIEAAADDGTGDADYTARRLSDFNSIGGYFEGVTITPVRRQLELEAFGVNVIDLESTATEYPRHDHVDDGQEEVYVPLRGSGELDLGERGTVPLAPGMMVRVSPPVTRHINPGENGIRVLALGGTPGKPYEPPQRKA